MKNTAKNQLHVTQLTDKLNSCLTQEINPLNGKILLFYFTCISILEILAYWKKRVFSFTASRIWLLTGIICLFLFIYDVGRKIFEDAKKHHFAA